MDGAQPTTPISFGDNVRVRSTAATDAMGLAALVGQVYGQTTPSVTGVEVIGELTIDYAINVHFDDRKENFWFAPNLLDFVDHSPGTEITMAGIPKKWVRSWDGAWIEDNLGSTIKRPWWKFW